MTDTQTKTESTSVDIAVATIDYDYLFRISVLYIEETKKRFAEKLQKMGKEIDRLNNELKKKKR